MSLSMDPIDILDDRDNGPEVQLNLPESMMKKIEELMGGTEQFDSAEFDPVAYINTAFPTEQSLAGVEGAAARCQFRLAGVQRDVARLVREAGERREAGREALSGAHSAAEALGAQLTEVVGRAERSERCVRDITAEIKRLDCAKTNLTAAITALNHLHLLAGAVSSLRALAQQRRYRELVHPLQAVMEVLNQLEAWQSVPRVATLRAAALEARADIAEQILGDFRAALNGGSGGVAVGARALSEASGVLDVLEEPAREQLLLHVLHTQLQEYSVLFGGSEEAGSVGSVEKRYAWLKKHLLAFEDTLAKLFPLHWRLSERIAQRFCQITKEQLSERLQREPLDCKTLLHAVQRTQHFEQLLHKRFSAGAELPTCPEGASSSIAGDQQSAGGWAGSIGACFEPHLSLYVNSLDASLRALLDTFILEAKAPGGGGLGLGAGGGAVASSCADLFVFYKKCLVQCAQLSQGEPMIELAGVFGKYLREYTTSVLCAWLPTQTHTHTHALQALLSTEPHNRYSTEEIGRIASVITTAEYCLETSVHLEQKLKEKVGIERAPRVSLEGERALLAKTIADCLQLLVADLEAACQPALQAMLKVPWASVAAVGDRSPYVAQLVAAFTATVPLWRDHLAASRKHFTQLCIRFADTFVPKFVQHVYRCRGLSAAGAEQLLLDAHVLKTALLELPSAGSDVKRAPPATYARVVVRHMARAELALKLAMAPLEADVVAWARRVLPDLTRAELQHVLDMKGARLSRNQHQALDTLFQQQHD